MIIKNLIEEDFLNYKKPSMIIMFPKCSWKCEKECGMQVCQNSKLATAPNIEVSEQDIVKRYLKNSITQSLVCSGLEPLDSLNDLLALIDEFRKYTNDDIVIYTGYTEEEVNNNSIVNKLNKYTNIIVKFGRFKPNCKSHYDEILGVNLVSDNQYGKIISKGV